MPRPDPLDLLRAAYNKSSQKKVIIKQKGNQLYFDRDIKLSLDTETAWESPKTKKQYNLGSLWLALQHHYSQKITKSEYFIQASALKLDTLSVAEADEIIKYFTGQINQTQYINNQLKQSLAQKGRGRDKPVVSIDEGQDQLQKKLKIQQKLDDQTQKLLNTIDYMSTFQKPINSKSRCLRYTQKSFINILTHLIENQSKSHEGSKLKEQSENQGKAKIAHFYQKKRLPIIIVPQKTVPGNISIQNIQKFLIKGQYDQYAKLFNPEVSKIQLQKVLKGKNIIFQANCRPELLSIKDWEFVVAVFVLGRDNQFDQWPQKSYKKVFENPLGYIIKFPKTPIGCASQWKIKSKILDPISRIGDKQIVQSIWNDIQNFIFTKI